MVYRGTDQRQGAAAAMLLADLLGDGELVLLQGELVVVLVHEEATASVVVGALVVTNVNEEAVQLCWHEPLGLMPGEDADLDDDETVLLAGAMQANEREGLRVHSLWNQDDRIADFVAGRRLEIVAAVPHRFEANEPREPNNEDITPTVDQLDAVLAWFAEAGFFEIPNKGYPTWRLRVDDNFWICAALSPRSLQAEYHGRHQPVSLQLGVASARLNTALAQAQNIEPSATAWSISDEAVRFCEGVSWCWAPSVEPAQVVTEAEAAVNAMRAWCNDEQIHRWLFDSKARFRAAGWRQHRIVSAALLGDRNLAETELADWMSAIQAGTGFPEERIRRIQHFEQGARRLLAR